jgi:mannose-6-phosphate isomerase-like protein (cupin superfamily)
MNGPSGVTGKIWGKTQNLYLDNNSEVHFLEGNKGGYCSKHLHKNKWNRFFVISGKIKVTIYRANGLEDETILEAGHFTDVPPMIKHRFEVLEDCLCIEIYWTDNLDSSDIVRDDIGGVKSE